MFGIDDALLGAGLGAAANFVGGLFTNSAADKQSKDQMKFQERMSNTQYQRGVTDMKAAGLNPMLAYAQGGASAPSGASAPVVNVGESVSRGVQAGASSAKTAATVAPQLANLAADTALKAASAKVANTNSALVAAQTPYLVDKALFDSAVSEGTMMIQGAGIKRAGVEKDYLSDVYGKTLATAALAGDDAARASSALKNLNPGDWIGKTFKSLRY